MKYNLEKHHRCSIRLKEYNYSQDGMYFVTICTQNRECLFGEIVDDKMELNNVGEIVLNCYNDLLNRYNNLKLDEFIIMPNHIHGILYIINNVGAPLAGAQSHDIIKNYTIGNIIGAYKSLVSNECLKISKLKNEYMGKLWQRNYYEHIIRDEKSLNKIRNYVFNNPLKWDLDRNNPKNL